jgi:hypothetical protein
MTAGNNDPEVVFTCYRKNPETGNLTLADCPKEGQEFIAGLATGCLFIKRDVFTLLSKPYFEFKREPESMKVIEGEDLGFMRKLSALGIEVFTDFSLVCKHQKTVDLLDINNYAINFSNRNWLAREAAVKAEMQGLMKEVYKAGFEAGQKKAAVAPKSTLWLPTK